MDYSAHQMGAHVHADLNKMSFPGRTTLGSHRWWWLVVIVQSMCWSGSAMYGLIMDDSCEWQKSVREMPRYIVADAVLFSSSSFGSKQMHLLCKGVSNVQILEAAWLNLCIDSFGSKSGLKHVHKQAKIWLPVNRFCPRTSSLWNFSSWDHRI